MKRKILAGLAGVILGCATVPLINANDITSVLFPAIPMEKGFVAKPYHSKSGAGVIVEFLGNPSVVYNFREEASSNGEYYFAPVQVKAGGIIYNLADPSKKDPPKKVKEYGL